MSFSENYVENKVVEVVRGAEKGLTFEELREYLESQGIYLNSVELRKVVASLIKRGTLCKYPSFERRKLLLKLCR
ncbi:MAG: hypothetical protein LM582_02050 [Desulfurococcaceae archaeon]|jgi:hypothetical protein|nr:hypothetical protein [Desulfurococcaceae archaeon]